MYVPVAAEVNEGRFIVKLTQLLLICFLIRIYTFNGNSALMKWVNSLSTDVRGFS